MPKSPNATSPPKSPPASKGVTGAGVTGAPAALEVAPRVRGFDEREAHAVRRKAPPAAVEVAGAVVQQDLTEKCDQGVEEACAVLTNEEAAKAMRILRHAATRHTARPLSPPTYFTCERGATLRRSRPDTPSSRS